MNVTRAKHWAVAAGALVLLGGCASGAWKLSHGGPATDRLPLRLWSHRAVERVVLHVYGREFDFVGYRKCDPATRDVRMQLLLDSGISALDVAIHDGENQRISGSPFEAIPHFAEVAMEDLRRIWGSRSAFCVHAIYGEIGVGGNVRRSGPSVTDGGREYPAQQLGDGSWLAVAPRDVRLNEPIRITLLDKDLVPEATVDYSDFDEDGVPREIHLVDLRRNHTLDVEVEEVHLVPVKDAAK